MHATGDDTILDFVSIQHCFPQMELKFAECSEFGKPNDVWNEVNFKIVSVPCAFLMLR